MKVRRALPLFIVLASPFVASAQTPVPPSPAATSMRWGVIGSIAPWQAGNRYKSLYEAQELDFSGGELRVGVTRGGTQRGEWAITYVRKTIAEGSSFVTAVGRRYRLGPQNVLTGFMVEQFAPVANIRHRAQIGFVLAAGLGQVRGTVTQIPDGSEHNLRDVLTIFARPQPYHPLGRFEVAAAFTAAPGMKLRISGGFNWPGTTVLSVTAMYFVGG